MDNEKIKYYSICVIALLIGMAVGYYISYDRNIKTTEEQLAYAESVINGHGLPGMEGYYSQLNINGEDITLGFISRMYNGGYSFLIKPMLLHSIGEFCGTRSEQPNMTGLSLPDLNVSEIIRYCNCSEGRRE